MVAPSLRSAATGTRNDSNTSTCVVAVPTGTGTDPTDIVYLFLNTDDSAGTVTCPGFTLKGSDSLSGGTFDGGKISWLRKVASAGVETGSYTMTLSGATRNDGVAVTVKGGDPTIAEVFAFVKATAPAAAPVAAANTGITTTAINNLLLLYLGIDDTGGVTGVTPPAGWTEEYDSLGGTSNAASLDSNTQAVAGATGTVTATIVGAGATASWMTVLIGVSPPAAPPAPSLMGHCIYVNA